MPAQDETIRLIYEGEDNRRGEWCVLRCRRIELEQQQQLFDASAGDAAVTVTCYATPGQLDSGQAYLFRGRWTTHEKYGKQFDARDWSISRPHGELGIIKYLQAAPGIGAAYATALYAAFGADTVEIVRTSPARVVEATSGGVTFNQAALVADYLERNIAQERVTVSIFEMTAGRGFPRNIAQRAISEWGLKAAETIREDPFELSIFPRVGFPMCDHIWRALGKDLADLRRQSRCVWHLLKKNSRGHTWHDVNGIQRSFNEFIGSRANLVAACNDAQQRKLIRIRREGNAIYVALENAAANEERVAVNVAMLQSTRGSNDWPNPADLDISDHQKQALTDAVSSPVGAFTGTPGTGKSYSTARLIQRTVLSGAYRDIAVAAPTGKAAVRLQVLLFKLGIRLPVTTTHRLLGVKSHTEGGGFGFRHNAVNPLPMRKLIIDESPVQGTDIMASFLDAVAPESRVLFVGDTAQLPPVGHGRPMYDLIRSGMISVGRLSKVERQAAGSTVINALAQIREGRPFVVDSQLYPAAGRNLLHIEAKSPEEIKRQLLRVMLLSESVGLNPRWDVQTICAVNKASALSRDAINAQLQEHLNVRGRAIAGTRFLTGDKVICLANGFYTIADPSNRTQPDNDDRQVFAANGEIGEVDDLSDGYAYLCFEAPFRRIRASVSLGPGAHRDEDDEEGEENSTRKFDLAYGISCHKAQGSEWPLVIVLLDDSPGARRVCSREWLHTAISRMQTACITIGKYSTAIDMLSRREIERRKTFLTEDVRAAVARLQKQQIDVAYANAG